MSGGAPGGYRERPAELPGAGGPGTRWAAAAGAVVWTRTAGPGGGLVLPDGCTDLIWHAAADGTGLGLLVAGPDTRAHPAWGPPGSVWTGLRFPPGAGPAVLGAPAHELRDRRLAPDALWPSGTARRLAERLAGAAAPGRVLEAFAAERLREAPDADPALPAIVAALRAGRPVRAVAEAVGVGERQLHRRCLPAFGYGPKTLARVLRLNRALDLARAAAAPAAAVAAAAGYADQAHLARETRALTGTTFGALLGR